MIDWLHDAFPNHEVNVAFARGIPADAFVRGIADQGRAPLAHGEGNGWAWAVHDMFAPGSGGYREVDYQAMCRAGAEIVVFVTEPCSPKAFPPAFVYHRGGRTVLAFSFEDVEQRVGDNPDYLSPELLAANLIGPDAYCDQEEEDDEHDCFDHLHDDRTRLVAVIAAHFGLPSPPLAAEVTAT
ncbi:hypothetical protein [Streptomyces hainanensis]|uniref:Uncharacterized protein n=1 Tax=Streptomyces hainanensis TaxID=402648 RepID=A0A4R4TI93_9ACTN|nr:hypothetical protein [Streptomyces hainanensis]TDC74019.1 hypothetical protein E1283_17255 [Streptomyces hainanensis]